MRSVIYDRIGNGGGASDGYGVGWSNAYGVGASNGHGFGAGISNSYEPPPAYSGVA